MEPAAEEILEKLKTTVAQEEMGEEEFDRYLEEVTRTHESDPATLDADPNLLNAGQKAIYNRYRRFFLSKKDAIETGTDQPTPLQFLIHGGPGIISLCVSFIFHLTYITFFHPCNKVQESHTW